MMRNTFFCLAALGAVVLLAQQPPAQAPGRAGGGRAVGGRGPAVVAKPEELARVKAKAEQIEAAVKELKAKKADATLVGDVDVFAKAGRFLLEYPELYGTQAAIDHSMTVLDSGIERAKQLQAGQAPWTSGKSRTYAYYSEMDGSVQPYHVSLPANYDPEKPTRLYVWMHGRQNNTTESEFIFSFMNPRPPGNAVKERGTLPCTTRTASPLLRSGRGPGPAVPGCPVLSPIRPLRCGFGKTWKSGL